MMSRAHVRERRGGSPCSKVVYWVIGGYLRSNLPGKAQMAQERLDGRGQRTVWQIVWKPRWAKCWRKAGENSRGAEG